MPIPTFALLRVPTVLLNKLDIFKNIYFLICRIGKEIDESLETQPSTTEFMSNYLWFNKAVARWLDIALYKALQRITKVYQLLLFFKPININGFEYI